MTNEEAWELIRELRRALKRDAKARQRVAELTRLVEGGSDGARA